MAARRAPAYIIAHRVRETRVLERRARVAQNNDAVAVICAYNARVLVGSFYFRVPSKFSPPASAR